MENTQQPENPEAEISLLDLLVTLADNVKLLILGPLAAGLTALAIAFAWPQTFESVAIFPGDQTTVSVMNSTAVLDPVIVSLGLNKDKTTQEARLALLGRVKAAVGRDKLLTLTVRDSSPQQAQATAQMLLTATYDQLRPRDSNKARIERQLVEAQRQLKNSQAAAAGLLLMLERSHSAEGSPKAGGTDLSIGYADLLGVASSAQAQLVALEAQLEGMTDSQLVQPPTLPEKAVSPKKGMIAVGATLATGFLLLLLVFIRNGLRSAETDPASAVKLARIRAALAWRSQPKA
jgi:LPS O-antigen subunit length determinant protein (WzzB/FepE family)